ncbi:endo-1,4-beta-xylanase [Ktedonospora formicarum]|uniref:Beta-xylanase n=1 Tax=Ktedonospora formicarum TaxID=2778364 RepID=A0A8J3I9U1_9CHLR|nr:endo-1,4-beta-xylanase [Ktedonospora formicarum]GHO48393.1 beta-xylanase [Ktedonospora formicarum]
MFCRVLHKRVFIIPLGLLLFTAISSLFFTRALAATTLGAAAAAQGRVFAAAVEGNRLGTTPYTTVFDREFAGTTPGNEMKWDTTEPSRGSFNFAPADAIVSHAQSHSMKIRGHTLVWYSQLPGWVSNISSGSDLLQAMNNHVTTEVTHFQGKIWYWDVVNEAFNEDGTRRSNPFQNLIGNAYIEDAFRAARAADPNAKLCINDYNIEGQNAKSNAVYALVQDFKSRGVPIDCVGFQAHLIVGQVPSDFQANLQRFANLGVDVQITELDIRMPTPASSANLQQQATDYSRVVTACLAVSRCNDITVWGVGDADSWIPGFFPGQGAALLFDDNYNPKLAYNAVLQVLNGGVGGTPTPTTTPTRTPTPSPTSTPIPGAACSVHYAITNQWAGGFGTNVTINNTGSSTITSWSLAWTFANGQVITQLWNGSYTQSGSSVIVTNVSYNGTIAVGGNTSFGFNGSWSGTNSIPTTFKLNGVTCNIA